MCLVGETRLWMVSDIRLREDNDELSKRLAQVEHAGSPNPKLMGGDDRGEDKLFDQVRSLVCSHSRLTCHAWDWHDLRRGLS